MAQQFDVAVIGAGPGGYTAAIRAAQLGFKTVCIDDWKNGQGKPSLGGTCLNVGCIPSKALLESSENYERVVHKFADHGIKAAGVQVDMATMLARKDKIVDTFTGGIALLFKKNKVASLHGRGSLVSAGDVYGIEIRDGDRTEVIEAKNVIIATGSLPRPLAEAPVDHDRILDNASALALGEIPKRLGVIGAGVIGLEMGSVWRRLGSDVTILEALPAFLPAVDEQVAKEAFRVFNGPLDLKIFTGVKLTSVKPGKKAVAVTYVNRDGNTQMTDFDRLIVAIGRIPNTSSLGAEKVGLKLDARGYVEVDERNRTNLPNVFAIGDAVRGPDACAQVLGGGCCRSGNHCRPSQSRQPRYDSLGDLYLPGDCLGRKDRAATQSRRAAISGRSVSLHCERTCACAWRDGRIHEDVGALRD